MATNSYTINGEIAQQINGGSVDIDMSAAIGVKAGCRQYPIPLLNKITVTSAEGELFKSTTIYAGYKIIEQMLGKLDARGNYNTSNPYLNTIIESGRFGIFEPALYNSASRMWELRSLNVSQINSLINIRTCINICVKIDYTKSDGSSDTAYVKIPGASDNRFNQEVNRQVPFYEQLGASNLVNAESVAYTKVESPERRSWFDVILTNENLDINLSTHIVDPKTTVDITVTLMAYIGTTPTPNNTFPILKMTPGSQTSVVVPFETYDPTIAIFNADQVNNPDTYDDTYGAVADYNPDTNVDTTISIEIIPPSA